MNNRLIVKISFIVMLLSLLSFRWPVDNGRLTSTFGESRGDHFHDGIDFVSENKKIYPVESGKLSFMWHKDLFPFENYPGSGNLMIIEHDKSFYSIYMHLDKVLLNKSIFSSNDVIGIIGDTGHSYAPHLHFSMLDAEKRESFNILKKLPNLKDNKAPEIFGLYIRLPDKTYYKIKDNDTFRLTKNYPLLVEIRDTITGRERLGVYKLKAEFNYKKKLDIAFDTLGYSKNGLINETKIFDYLYDEKGYYKVKNLEYLEGQNVLTVIASDFTGNETKKTFKFNVEKDME